MCRAARPSRKSSSTAATWLVVCFSESKNQEGWFPLLRAPKQPQQHETTEQNALGTPTQLTDLILEVKGDTIEASASDRATPVCAVRSAPQSFPPSPHMPTTTPDAMNASITRICWCFGWMRRTLE